MATPKKKTAKSRSKVRHTAYMEKQRTRLVEWISLVTCDECGASKKNHTACSECWTYRWNKITKAKKQNDVTVVEA